MLDFHKKVACAAIGLLTSTNPSLAQDDISALRFVHSNQVPTVEQTNEPDAKLTSSRKKTAKAGSREIAVRGGVAGSFEKQISSVSTACLKPGLMQIVRNASSHFGSAAIITSGYRRSRSSYHGKCMAADVQIAGVSSGTLARYFRNQSGVGGVGTYGHTRSVHVDVAPRRFTWHHGRRRTAELAHDVFRRNQS